MGVSFDHHLLLSFRKALMHEEPTFAEKPGSHRPLRRWIGNLAILGMLAMIGLATAYGAGKFFTQQQRSMAAEQSFDLASGRGPAPREPEANKAHEDGRVPAPEL